MRKKTGRMFLAALLLLCAALFAPKTWAEDSKTWAEDIWTRDKLTGDWWGARTYLSDHGINFNLRLSQFYQGVTSGGAKRTSEYGGIMDYIVTVDGHKLGLWKGLGFFGHATSRWGNDILADAGAFVLPNAALMYPLPGDFSGTRITGGWVSQELFKGEAQVLAGKLNSFDLLQGMFPNVVDYGLDGFMNANSFLSVLPWGRWLTLSQYGAAGWTIKDGMPSTGVIVVGQENVTDDWGSWDDSFGDGVGILAFHRFLFKIDDKPGYLYIGGGGSTKDYPSLDPVDWTVIPGEGLVDTEEKKAWGVAAYWYQDFWRKEGNDKRFAHFFVGGSVADNNPSFSNYDVFAAVQAFGLSDARPHDRMGIAYHYNHMANDYVDLVNSIPGVNMRDNFWTFEVYYNYQINPWLHLTPNFQYAQNENDDDDPAVILGVRLVIDL
jgi:porin